MAARKSVKQVSQLYERFVHVCEQWPIDSSRRGRDLGSHIKQNLETKFRNREIEEKEASKMLDSLIKISSNHYKNKYPRAKETAFIQEAKEVGQYVLSTDFQNKVKEKKPGLFARLTGATRKDKRL